MSDTCTVTISGHGKPVTAELSGDEGKAISELAELLAGAPRRPSELSAAETALRRERDEAATKNGSAFLAQVAELTELDAYQMRFLLAYVQLIRFGDRGLCSDDNWILEVINSLLGECIFSGIGEALAKGPGIMLRDLALAYLGFLATIDRTRDAAKEYSRLLEDPSANAAVSESIIALQKSVSEHEGLMRGLRETVHSAVVAKKGSAREGGAKRPAR